LFQEIATSFSGGGARGYEYGPAFVPADICRMYRSASEKFLHLVGFENPLPFSFPMPLMWHFISSLWFT